MFAPTRQSVAARILVVTDGDAGTMGTMGATLGIEEARHAWQLLRRPLVMEALDIGNGDGSAPSMRGVAASTCVVTTMDGPTRGAWDEALDSSHVLHVDGAAHRAPSDICVSSRFVVGTPGDSRSQLLWHPSLDRYGARQLNDRFRSRFSKGMDEAAWAAWFAVKVASEAVLRVGSDPRALAAFVANDLTAFDGHKGRPLRFGSDHRLIQPLYVVRGATGGGESVEEVAQSEPVAPSCPALPATS
jgi:hypothetical protein